jgi:hypothetical protein
MPTETKEQKEYRLALARELMRDAPKRPRGRPKGTRSPNVAAALAVYEVFEKGLEEAGHKGKWGRLDKTVDFLLELQRLRGLPVPERQSLINTIKRARRRKRQQ